MCLVGLSPCALFTFVFIFLLVPLALAYLLHLLLWCLSHLLQVNGLTPLLYPNGSKLLFIKFTLHLESSTVLSLSHFSLQPTDQKTILQMVSAYQSTFWNLLLLHFILFQFLYVYIHGLSENMKTIKMNSMPWVIILWAKNFY